jgi:hypothetical protein
MEGSLELSTVQKRFLLRTIKFLIEDNQITQGRQLLIRFLGTDTFSDEDYAQIEQWTDDFLAKGEEE